MKIIIIRSYDKNENKVLIYFLTIYYLFYTIL